VTTKKLANIFLIIGVVLTVSSTVWWGVVYTFAGQQTGESLMSSISCLVSVGPECNFLRAMAWLQGQPIYEPPVFWFSIGILFIAICMKRSISNDAQTNGS
jgi:hypothetical protein